MQGEELLDTLSLWLIIRFVNQKNVHSIFVGWHLCEQLSQASSSASCWAHHQAWTCRSSSTQWLPTASNWSPLLSPLFAWARWSRQLLSMQHWHESSLELACMSETTNIVNNNKTSLKWDQKRTQSWVQPHRKHDLEFRNSWKDCFVLLPTHFHVATVSHGFRMGVIS